MKQLVRSLTAKRLKKLDAELERAARSPGDAGAIHDLRVSIRRLSRELKVFEPWFDAGEVKRIRRRLRKLLDRCAAVRNCDIAIEVLRTAGWQDPKVFTALEEERGRTRKVLAGKLARWRLRGRVRKWRENLRVARTPGGELRGTAGDNAQRLLPAMAEDLFRAGRGAARPDSSHYKMHRFRLKAKRMRYTLELFEKFYGTRTTRMMESLKGLQEKLGAINDCATTLEMIHSDPGAAAAVSRLAGEREARFRQYWRRSFGPREQVRWKAALGAADGKE